MGRLRKIMSNSKINIFLLINRVQLFLTDHINIKSISLTCLYVKQNTLQYWVIENSLPSGDVLEVTTIATQKMKKVGPCSTLGRHLRFEVANNWSSYSDTVIIIKVVLMNEKLSKCTFFVNGPFDADKVVWLVSLSLLLTVLKTDSDIDESKKVK